MGKTEVYNKNVKKRDEHESIYSRINILQPIDLASIKAVNLLQETSFPPQDLTEVTCKILVDFSSGSFLLLINAE